MAARTKARKRALDVLYSSELRGLALDGLLDQYVADHRDAGAPALNAHTVRIVRGVVEHQERLDQVLAEHSVGWSLQRMPALDRNLLRLALFELLYVDDVPDAVAISEAVRLAGALSTDDSAAFVNGLLARIAERKPSLTV